MSLLNLMVVTPEETVLDCQSESVVVPLIDGQKGFLPQHAPMIGRLGPGVMKVEQAGAVRQYFLEGGFVQMDRNVLSVLTGIAVPVEKLNVFELNKKLKELEAESPETPAEKLTLGRQILQTKAMLKAAESRG